MLDLPFILELTQVDPNTTRFKNVPDGLYIFDDVVCGVDEEAGGYTIPHV